MRHAELSFTVFSLKEGGLSQRCEYKKIKSCFAVLSNNRVLVGFAEAICNCFMPYITKWTQMFFLLRLYPTLGTVKGPVFFFYFYMDLESIEIIKEDSLCVWFI